MNAYQFLRGIFRTKTHVKSEMISAEKAITWVRNHRISGKGIIHSSAMNVPYPEVTGYFIPTLVNWGEKDLARDLARWEASIQELDGAFPAIDGVPYTFDTAQVVRGFLSVVDELPELRENLRLACDYVAKHIDQNGRVITQCRDALKLPDESFLSEYGNLYVLPPLLQAGRKLSEPRYVEAALRGLSYFKQKKDLVAFKSEFGTFSHYFGYMIEALIDLGEKDLAKEGLEQVIRIQRADGAIPAFPGVSWICSVGTAQLAVTMYRLHFNENADKALAYLEKVQNHSGGFYGSYGQGSMYFPKEEISWAVKFFLDACLLKHKLHSNDSVD